MLKKLFIKIFGSRNDRTIRTITKTVNHINDIECIMQKLSDRQLSEKTIEFRKRLLQGETLNHLLPEAFAVVREASKRICGMRHFDVQLLGGIILNENCIAEMRTGEGKTITSTLPAYLNALSGKGVHIVTVNDYLSKRDAKNNYPLFNFLGMSVGINLPELSLKEKQAAYAADITYGTNNEYGFDYLRSNMIFNIEDKIQRNLHYALIDEVDSILIDEARTPLIISGVAKNSLDIYRQINQLIPYLIRQAKEDSESFQGKGHFSVDEKSRQITFTERGLIFVEQLLVEKGFLKKGDLLYYATNIKLLHHVIAAVKAHVLFTRNVDYIVKNGKIIIVDEHTGRTMPGRIWSDGLHQAIEAKENLHIQPENQTLASITFQNYFRLYDKIAGMTGTAYTEEFEFSSIYNLNTIVIPTNKPMIRKDLPDLIYMTEKEKIKAIIDDIKNCVHRGQPVLVGTISIEKSELISNELKKINISHKVLNAKRHSIEADIIAQAGYPGAVTIATNMAGRGTDIILGGNYQAKLASLNTSNKENMTIIKKSWQKLHDDVLSAGGLHVIGSERHESRRIDNQLRGRSGRQGDIGSSRFYLSMEDSLIRIFASERILNMMRKLGIKPGEAIEHPWITKAIANAQRKVEMRNFEIRKQLLEYDNVTNEQRQAIYAQRNELLNASDIMNTIENIRKDVITKIVENYIIVDLPKEKWNISELENQFHNIFDIALPVSQWLTEESNLDISELCMRIHKYIITQYQYQEQIIGSITMRQLEKNVILQTIDELWKEHLAAMDYLRKGIHLRGFAQKDPKQEYKRESFDMFSKMLELLKYEVLLTLSQIQSSMVKKLQHIQESHNG